MFEAAEIGVVAGSFAGDQRVQRMVKIVVPLRVEAVSTKLLRPNETSIVECTFCNDANAAI